MELNIAIAPGSIEFAALTLLLLSLVVLQLYRRFPVHLIYRSKIGFESMLDSVDEPLAVISHDFVIKRVNRAYVDLTGRRYRSCIGAKCYYMLRGRTSPCEDCLLADALRLSAAQSVDLSPRPSGDGSLHITFTPYAMPKGGRAAEAEVCVIEHIRDITALEKMKNDLERRNGFLTTLTRRLRAARRTVNSELKVARQIQRGLMPSDVPIFDGMRVDIAYHPAADVGGDIYDFIKLDKNRVGVFIGDASGHGLASALIGTLSKMSLYNHSKADLSPSELLSCMNRDIFAHVRASHYLTCVWSIFDFEAKRLRYSRAGHPLQLVSRKNGEIEALAGDGVFLGIMEGSEFEQRETPFEKGDRFFFFTDGLFDVFGKEGAASAGKMLGFDGLKELVRQTSRLPLNDVIPALKEALSDYAHDDDYTLIVAEIA